MRRLQHPALILLCLVWLLAGLTGHAPWKGGDGATFLHFLSLWQHGDWRMSVATPPLYFGLATATAWLTSSFLALHDGARLASGVCIALALVFTARAAQALYGEDHRWPAALALLGTVGLLLRGHEMNVYTAQLAGVAMVLDGLARLPKNEADNWALPAGLGVMLLATGLVEPLMLALLAALLPVFIPAYRSIPARRNLIRALLGASVLGLVWVAVLWSSHAPLIPALQLQRWPGAWTEARDALKPLYVSSVLPWYLWPTWPLAVWAIYRTRHSWRAPATLMPLLVFLVLFVLFSLSLGAGEDKLLALAAPVALLAAAGVMSLRRGAAYAFLWFGVMLFGFLAIVFWVYWSAHDLGVPARLARRLSKRGVEDIGAVRQFPLLLGAAATILWLAFLARVQRTPLRPLLVWSAGMTFVWVLLLSLFLDIFDPRLSYVRVGDALAKHVPRHACINASEVSPQQRALLAYHSGRKLRAVALKKCDWMLVQSKRRAAVPPVAPRWVLQKTLQRAGDRDDRFLLYARRR